MAGKINIVTLEKGPNDSVVMPLDAILGRTGWKVGDRLAFMIVDAESKRFQIRRLAPGERKKKNEHTSRIVRKG